MHLHQVLLRGGGHVHRVGVVTRRPELLQLGVQGRGENNRVLPGQSRQRPNHRRVPGAAVQGGDDHHQCALRERGAHQRGHEGPVELGQARLHVSQVLGQLGHEHRSGAAPHLCAHGVVHGQDVDPVAGAGGQGRQQQGGLDLGVEPGGVPQPGSGQSTRVDDDENPPIALRAPGAYQHLAPAGSGAPVDGAHVVSDDVLAQGVELGPLPAHHDGAASVHLPQPGQARVQVAARAEGRQDPDGGRDVQ